MSFKAQVASEAIPSFCVVLRVWVQMLAENCRAWDLEHPDAEETKKASATVLGSIQAHTGPFSPSRERLGCLQRLSRFLSCLESAVLQLQVVNLFHQITGLPRQV